MPADAWVVFNSRYGRKRKAISIDKVHIPYKDKAVLKQMLRMENPVLWDIDNPYLYKLHTSVMMEKQQITCDEAKIIEPGTTNSIKSGIVNSREPGADLEIVDSTETVWVPNH